HGASTSSRKIPVRRPRLAHRFIAGAASTDQETYAGVFNGPLPLLFNSEAFQDLSVLLYGDRPKDTSIDFGAHQVILVRSQESKRKLPPEFRQALVMTVFEAKGLEFGDVLLYNFFKDSKATKEWRTVTAYQERRESLPGAVRKIPEGYPNGKDVRPLEFDPSKHSLLESELKHLYTAVTRARVNLWVYDESVENSAPAFDYFQRQGVALAVDKSQISDEGAGKLDIKVFPQKSSKEEWQAKGQQLFKLSLYGPAARCFSISGDAELEQYANALALAKAARELQAEERVNQYVDAADLFSMLGQFEKASRCLYAAKEYRPAGRIFACLDLHAYAADAFAKAGDSVETAVQL
ncbi:MAG: hypothetical protein BJ554DRAFT_7879, partial [Olpidium bornovanus]